MHPIEKKAMMQVVIRVQIRASSSCMSWQAEAEVGNVGFPASQMIQDIGSQSTLVIASATRAVKTMDIRLRRKPLTTMQV